MKKTTKSKAPKKTALTVEEARLWDDVALSVARNGQTFDHDRAAVIGTVAAEAADQIIQARRAWK